LKHFLIDLAFSLQMNSINEKAIFSIILDLDIILTKERESHIYFRHPELSIFSDEILRTVSEPNYYFFKDESEIHFVSINSIFNGKYLVVVVIIKWPLKRAFIVTSYLTRSKPKWLV
jgi:hypothetical protein